MRVRGRILVQHHGHAVDKVQQARVFELGVALTRRAQLAHEAAVHAQQGGGHPHSVGELEAGLTAGRSKDTPVRF